MNAIFSHSTSRLDKTSNVSRLTERIRQCVHERELAKEQRTVQMEIDSITHYTERLKRSIEENPLVGQALFRFYHLTKNFTRQTNRKRNLLDVTDIDRYSLGFSSTLLLESNESKLSLDDTTLFDQLYTPSSDLDLSKTSLHVSPSIQFNPLPSMKSTTHFLQPTKVAVHQPGGLLTKTTQIAVNKVKSTSLK